MVTLSNIQGLPGMNHGWLYLMVTYRTTNITELCKDMRMVAALTDDEKESERLLMAAKRLADAFSDMLRLAQPDSKEVRFLADWRYPVVWDLFMIGDVLLD